MLYLRSVLRENSNRCRGTVKLNKISNLIESKHAQNHTILLYDSDLYELKAKYRTAAKTSREKLSKVFKDTCRNDQASKSVSCKNFESANYKSRREVEPTIPSCATEFCQQIQLTQYGMYYRGEVIVGPDIGVIFYSDKIAQILTEIDEIQFDGTFYTVPIQFYQLWTICGIIRRHVIPFIHCLLTEQCPKHFEDCIVRIRAKNSAISGEFG